ncbi:hypothetical protein ACLK1Y_20060 [Escherichia coli]
MGVQPPDRGRFLQLAHVGLFFFGNRTAERQFGQLLCFFTQLLSTDLAQTRDFRFKLGFFNFKLSVLFGAFHQGQRCLLVADRIKQVARRLISFFSISFMLPVSDNK